VFYGFKETMSCCKQHQTPVICTFLDASKAFYRLHYCKLFKLLLKLQLPAHTLWVLINLYTNSCVRIAWGAIISDYFSVINGVKQSAVLSLVLFYVYIHDLLLSLKKAGFGCYIGAHFVGTLAYADDIVFVAPSATALRKMLAICEGYVDEYCICFNAAKSEYLVILLISRHSIAKEFQSYIFYVAKTHITC
jgi:Reverse transcriptase (RNA-dependent DNA polymerase)